WPLSRPARQQTARRLDSSPGKSSRRFCRSPLHGSTFLNVFSLCRSSQSSPPVKIVPFIRPCALNSTKKAFKFISEVVFLAGNGLSTTGNGVGTRGNAPGPNWNGSGSDRNDFGTSGQALRTGGKT